MEFYENHEKEQFSPNQKIDIEEFVDEEATYLEELKHKQDDFLDVYSMYLHAHSEFAKSLLERKAIELEIIDPTFDFELE
ncbi:hypothetical protein ACFL3D_00025 [Candidatus Omnitrophota bacterium]